MNAEDRAYQATDKIVELLSEYGIRVPEDIGAEVATLIEKQYEDVEELAWMYEDLTK